VPISAIGPLLGSGKIAEVFAYGENVLKLYRSPEAKAQAFGEAATLAIVGSHGLPSPEVHEVGSFDGRWGLVMSRAPGEALGTMVTDDPILVPAALEEMVKLHLRIHVQSETRLRPLKSRLAANIARASQLTPERAQRLIAGLTQMPDGDRLCHGDFHPWNIMGPPGATMIVDWPDCTSGPPAADVCRTFVLLISPVPELAHDYVVRYSEASGILRDEILAWLPYVAAARLAENVPNEEEALLRMAGAD
jgi:hypothetical protein